ncbi:hypothetical protein Pelo_9315 [Pelomyxa schiedti]|nr:hypothetical protein Pelo_9315 [Pelomyxa schiedti]
MGDASPETLRVVGVSKLVWEWVVLPGWLTVTTKPKGRHSPVDDETNAVTLYSLGGGLFPLVPRVCSLVRSMNKSRYFGLRCAAQSGAISCVKWITTHECVDTDITSSAQVKEGRNEKVCLNALVGLVRGGHVHLAARLVGCDPAVCQCLGVRWPGSPGSQKDVDMRERIKGSSKLKSLLCSCVGTPVESVRWAFDWLGMREPWEFVNIVFGAIDAGNAPLVQWMVTTFNLSKVFNDPREKWLGMAQHLAEGKCPMLLKWWIESFSFPLAESREFVFGVLVGNKYSTVELCEWCKRHLDVLGTFFKHVLSYLSVKNTATLKWAIGVFPTVTWLDNMCVKTGDLELVKWVVTDLSVKPRDITFRVACDSKKENLELVKWLSQRVTLSPTDLYMALCQALKRSNTEIADWIVSTFEVMNVANSTPGAPYSLFAGPIGRTPDGLKWFLQHIDIPQTPPESAESIIRKGWISSGFSNRDAMFLILDALHISLRSNSELLQYILCVTLNHGTLKDVMILQSKAPPSVDDVVHCISNTLTVSSSKIIKWIVTYVGLERIKTDALYTRLVECSMYWNKTHCLLWLIDTFDIQLNEVLLALLKWFSVNSDLYMWQSLVNRFPTIDTETVRSKCMNVITHTPAIAAWSMARFSLSQSEIASKIRNNLEMRLWCAS